MLHAAGGPPATDTMVTPRVRPSLVLRSVSGPADAAAGRATQGLPGSMFLLKMI